MTFSPTMSSTHTGRLQSVDDPSIDIPAIVSFDRNKIYISSEGQALGQWPLEEVETEREEANRFRLLIAEERWTLAADDPAHFLVASLDALSNRGFASRLRSGARRVAAAGITVGSLSLAVATTITAYAGGLLVGRYRLDGSG